MRECDHVAIHDMGWVLESYHGRDGNGAWPMFIHFQKISHKFVLLHIFVLILTVLVVVVMIRISVCDRIQVLLQLILNFFLY